MSFATYEESRHHGAPVELLLFTYGVGAGAYFAYTTAEQAITLGDGGSPETFIEYTPLPIQRGALQSSGTLDKATLQLRMPRTAGVLELFRIWPPSEIVSLVIRLGHVGDGGNEFLAYWSGRVLAGSFEGSQGVLTCEPVTTSMRRSGLRRHWQHGCPHVLYGPQCKANKAAATSATTVVSIDGRSVTVDAGWLPSGAEANDFLNGMMEWTTAEGNNEVRTIIKVTGGDTFLLSGLVPGLAASDAVSVVKGCAHTTSFCRDVHDNIQNYGGQPWIPVRSPFGFRNEFY